MMRTDRLSLKLRISFTATLRMLPSHTPMMVTARRPDSWARKSLPANTITTQARVSTLRRYSGTQCRRSTKPRDQAPARPVATPKPMLLANSCQEPCPVSRYWNTRTASRAPTGSMRMPSQRSTWLTPCSARIVRSRGLITVGPVTTARAANSMEMSPGRPAT
jgi:hypothetical protein